MRLQNASGIQSSQSVTANEDTYKEAKSSLHPAHRGISVITPLPCGGGEGGGASDPQNASGIQISQNVSAIFNTNKGQRKAYLLLIGVSR